MRLFQGTPKDRSAKQQQPTTATWKMKSQESRAAGGNGRRKDHWASARVPSTDQPDDEQTGNKPTTGAAARRQQQSKTATSSTGTSSRQRPSDSSNSAGAGAQPEPGGTPAQPEPGPSKAPRKAPPKKLALQEKPRPRASKDSGGAKKPPSTRTSVTRSEIQEYWMQGYEHVQRTEKTTGNIEQWQSAAMKSLQEKKDKDALWATKWRQQEQQDEAKPCSSKTLEPFGFA